MTMRPVPARWFEILVATEDLVKGVEALARTGDIELEVYSETTQRVSMPNLRDQFADYDKLLRRYQQYWPNQYLHPSEAPARPDRRLRDALAKLVAWQAEADPEIERLESLQREQAELAIWQEFLALIPGNEIDFSHAAAAGPAFMQSIRLDGAARNAKGSSTGLDAKASRALTTLAGGDLVLALGAEMRREKTEFGATEVLKSNDVNGDRSSSGVNDIEAFDADRDVFSAYAEFNAPITRELELQFALRHRERTGEGRPQGERPNPEMLERRLAEMAKEMERLQAAMAEIRQQLRQNRPAVLVGQAGEQHLVVAAGVLQRQRDGQPVGCRRFCLAGGHFADRQLDRGWP